MSTEQRHQQSPEVGVAARCAALRAAGLPVLLTAEELAEVLRLPSAYFVDRQKAKWPHIRAGGQVVFGDEEIAAIIQTLRSEPSADPYTAQGLADDRITRKTRYRRPKGADTP